MTDLKITPDVEAIAIQRLLNDRGVTDLIDDRIGPGLPSDAVFPFLTVALATDDDVGGFGVLTAAALDIQAWGIVPSPASSGKRDVSLLARRARASLMDPGWWGSQAAGGIVSGVTQRVGIQWLPDAETNRSRYILQIVIHAHPSPAD